MLKHIHYVCLIILSAEFLTYAAEIHRQKIIWGIAVNDGGKGHCIGKKTNALYDLLHAVTGDDYKECIETCKDVQKTTQLLIQNTGMHIEPEGILIPLNISDPKDLELKSHSSCWDLYNFMSDQLFDEEKKAHIIIPRYWPYAWFVDALDGNVVEIPLYRGRFLARLYLEPAKETSSLFHIHAARTVATCLGMPNERIGETIKQRYDIDIEGL